MKNVILLFFFIFFFIPARAEYGTYHTEFVIKTHKGKQVKGFAEFYQFEFSKDSANYPGYALKYIQLNFTGEKGLFNYSKLRLSYNYYDDSEDLKFYYLEGDADIPVKSIKEITIVNIYESSYATGIWNELTLKDMAWMKTPPLQKARTGSELCSYNIYVHEKSPKIDRLLKELERLNASANPEETDESEYSETHDPNIEFDSNVEFDKKLVKILKQLSQFKVVIISSCSC